MGILYFTLTCADCQASENNMWHASVMHMMTIATGNTQRGTGICGHIY